jgi:hypothetical protein
MGHSLQGDAKHSIHLRRCFGFGLWTEVGWAKFSNLQYDEPENEVSVQDFHALA